eukprot:1130849-Prorocentrum_lima.AAC.1
MSGDHVLARGVPSVGVTPQQTKHTIINSALQADTCIVIVTVAVAVARPEADSMVPVFCLFALPARPQCSA